MYLQYCGRLKALIRELHRRCRYYDLCDLVAHVYRSYKARPYEGVHISDLFRDEASPWPVNHTAGNSLTTTICTLLTTKALNDRQAALFLHPQ